MLEKPARCLAVTDEDRVLIMFYSSRLQWCFLKVEDAEELIKDLKSCVNKIKAI